MEDKNLYLLNDDELYAEAQARIKECGEKKRAKLDLSSNFYQLKEIPPEIAELDALEELDIRNIGQKKIPGFIGSISSLKKLSLGSISSAIHPQDRVEIVLPPELGNLRNLRCLSLGFDIPDIPLWVWDLENLEELCINNDSIETVPARIKMLKNLRQLKICGATIAWLPDEMGALPELAVLELCCPKLKSLPESFSNLKSMEKFTFTNCNLRAIPDFVCAWPELATLEISMANTFQGPYTLMRRMPENIGNLTNLSDLSLSGTSFTKIPASLGNCPLRTFDLAGSFKTLPDAIGNLSLLESFEFCSDKPVRLPDSFGNLAALKNLTVTAPSLEIPASFGNLAGLEALAIYAINTALPETIGGLASLTELGIDSCEMQAIPETIGACRNLKSLFLVCDKLAELPESIGKLKKLECLSLDTFSLKALPRGIGSLALLESVDIFSGALIELPKSMGNLKNLKNLTLDFHNLRALPDWFGKFSYIKRVYLKTAKENINRWPEESQKKKDKLLSFDELAKMSRYYRDKMLEAYTVNQIDAVLCSAPSRRVASQKERDAFKEIMLVRCTKLNRKFKWTEENKKRVVQVSEEFIKAWEDGMAKAIVLLDALYAHDPDSFKEDHYNAEITLYPEIFLDKGKDMQIYDVIARNLDPAIELNSPIEYNPATKEKAALLMNSFICRDLSWNIEGFGDLDLQDQYISYSLHILYSHNHWANEDILKINHIYTEAKITHIKFHGDSKAVF